MAEFWETAFNSNQLMWGLNPSASAIFARDRFERAGIRRVLIPGIGYGRNAKAFLDRGMAVTGIEISATAIALARSQLGLQIPIHHGSVTAMPFDHLQYEGIFCYAVLHLLDSAARAKFIRDCYQQLAPLGQMIFTVVSKRASLYREGTRIGVDWYERAPGLTMYFYDQASITREFSAFGLVEVSEFDEPGYGGTSLPFIHVICRKP